MFYPTKDSLDNSLIPLGINNSANQHSAIAITHLHLKHMNVAISLPIDLKNTCSRLHLLHGMQGF